MSQVPGILDRIRKGKTQKHPIIRLVHYQWQRKKKTVAGFLLKNLHEVKDFAPKH